MAPDSQKPHSDDSCKDTASQRSNRSASDTTTSIESKSTASNFLSPSIIALVFAGWILGGAFIFGGWWHSAMAQKVWWASGLLLWIIFSPLLMSMLLMFSSGVLLLSGFPIAGELVSRLAVAVFRLAAFQFKIAGIRLPSFVIDIHVMTLVCNGKLHEAEQYARAQLEEKENIHGSASACLCDPLISLARVSRRLGNFSEAEGHLIQALRNSDNEGGFYINATRAILKNSIWEELGKLYLDAFKFEQAEQCWFKAIDMLQQPENPQSTADNEESEGRLRGLLGKLYISANRLDEADTCMMKGRAGARKLVSDLTTLDWRRDMAILRTKQGRIEEAEEFLKSVSTLTEKYAKSNPEDRSESLGCEGFVAMAKNQLQQSEECYKKALSLAENLFGNRHPAIAGLLYNYATLLSKQGRDRESAEAISRADSIKNEVQASLQCPLPLPRR